MTREEALQILDTIPTIGEQVDALELAIEALSAEPCEDCISRAEAQKRISIRLYESALNTVDYDCKTSDVFKDIAEKLGTLISELPSVQPKPKTDVLDKIRTEIEFIPTIEWKDDGTTYILASYFKKQVLEIIDKYKAESEDKE